MNKLARLVNQCPILLSVSSISLAMALSMVLGTLTSHYVNGYELSESAKTYLYVSIPALGSVLYLLCKIANKSDEIEDEAE